MLELFTVKLLVFILEFFAYSCLTRDVLTCLNIINALTGQMQLAAVHLWPVYFGLRASM